MKTRHTIRSVVVAALLVVAWTFAAPARAPPLARRQGRVGPEP